VYNNNNNNYNNNNNTNNNNNSSSKIIAYTALFTIKTSIALYIRSIKSTNKIIRMFIMSQNFKVFRLKGNYKSKR